MRFLSPVQGHTELSPDPLISMIRSQSRLTYNPAQNSIRMANDSAIEGIRKHCSHAAGWATMHSHGSAPSQLLAANQTTSVAAEVARRDAALHSRGLRT